MFAKKLVTQSMIDAVNSVLGETSEETTKPTQLLDEEKKRMLMEPELDETGFHKAAHAAKKAGQSHFEFQGKKYPATAKSHAEAIEMDEAADKVPTSTGMKVYGSSYGNSAKARKDQTKHSVDDVKGPKTKELKAMDKEPKRNLDEDGDCVTPAQAKKIADKEVGKHEKGLHKGQKPTVKSESYFTNKLLNSLNEAKSTGTEEIFSDNNMGEEMTDKQKSKREKIVMSMKSGEAGMKQRYGKNWKNVMYATATKQAMKEDSSDTYEGEELDEDDRSDAIEKQSKDNLTKSMKAMGKNDRQIKYVHKKTDDVIKKAAGEKVKKEEVEHLDEGVMDKMSLSALWHKHGHHHYVFDQGHGHGYGSSHHNDQAMTAIENHVRKHHGNKVADDMVHHSELRTAADEYLGGKDARNAESTAKKLRAKHKIQGDMHGNLDEEVEHLNEDETLKAIAKKHDMKYHPGTYGANMSHPTKGYVNVNRYGEWGHYKQGRFDRGHGSATAHGDSSQHFKDLDKHLSSLKEASPAKNQDVADKAYLKHKPGTVKGQLTQIGRFLRGKPEIKESNDSHTHAAHYENDKGEWTGMNLFTAKDDDDAIKQAQAKCKEGCKLSKVERHTTVKEAVEVETEKSIEKHKITTDMLSGRVRGGKLNSFKNFKVDLVTSGEETIPADTDEGEDTREKQKITTNPGPVDVKLDDKLTGPTPYTHFSSEHQITHEEVQMDEKVIAGTPGWEKMKKNVKDKSGAIHTPMSRARDLARKSFSKLKKETMMGKISN